MQKKTLANSGIVIQDLKESNEFLNILFNQITSAIFMVDKDVRIQSFNDSFKTLFDATDEITLGKICGNALGCINVAESNADCGTTKNCEECQLRLSMLTSFLKKIPTDKSLLTREFIINEIRILKYLQFSTRYIHFNNQEMVIIIVDDVTDNEIFKIELENKNKKLLELNQQKNELLGVAAHDIRNPLGVISSFSEIMVEAVDELQPDNLKEMLGIIYKTSRFALHLLDDILDYSKIESGILELKIEKTDYVALVQENVSRNELMSIQKSIPIEFTYSSANIIAEIDPKKIDQVLNNLIGNAIKFSFPGNSIKVNIIEEKDYIITSIEDQGQGIPEKDIPHLFEPFRQTSIKSTNHEKGSGLGLAIVKKIIDGHNGRLVVSSKQGEGSIFSFYLPKH